MSTRRAPLANVPNGANSPYRNATTSMLAGGKRPREASAISNLARDIPYGQPPPKKQHVLSKEDVEPSVSTKTTTPTVSESKVFSRGKNPNARPTALERKLEAAREVTRATRQEKENTDSIRQWQNFYRKAFPTFTFYFESIPEDARAKCSRQVIALGARVEKFFSRSVTHVVTTRSRIPESDSTIDSSVAERSQNGSGQPRTINPSLLERAPDGLHLRRGDAGSRRSQLDGRKEGGASADVLSIAKQFGMKIWQLEKLNRIISTMNEGEGGHGQTMRHGTLTSKHRDEVNLSQVLRNEKLNVPSDRDPAALLRQLTLFKGPFIYIHDITQQTKPVMVREYEKVASRSDGAWPQFRSTSLGKCPFIEEPPKRERRDDDRQRMQAKAAARTVQKTRAVETKAPSRVEQEARKEETQTTEPIRDESREVATEDVDTAQRPLDPPKTLPTKLNSQKSSESFIAPAFPRTTHSRVIGREPAASGIQPSNITSAIRSQMISSTAAGPGMKAGTSKEVHQLKRKVFEKSGSQITSGIPRSQGMTDIAGSLRAMRAPVSRTAKAKPQEKLEHVHEDDTTQSEEESKANQRANSKAAAAAAVQKRRVPTHDPKPGYCENCRAKYDDFDEHTRSRRHRDFAATESNWTELDSLLFQLERPLKARLPKLP